MHIQNLLQELKAGIKINGNRSNNISNANDTLEATDSSIDLQRLLDNITKEGDTLCFTIKTNKQKA